ncbi:MAG TPA: hypothetical protein VG101_10085 [Puia sp.]|nr:hypothetical protein [Puia sp.]
MPGRSLVVAGLLAALAILLPGCPGCQTATECGSWSFTGNPGAQGPNTYGVNDGFTFTPANCNNSCNCSVDGIIQMVMVYDAANETWLESANGELYGSSRATADHWMIDQFDSWGNAYYGLENDGVTFDAAFNNAGSNGVVSTLNDLPGGQGSNIFFYALDVDVCYNSKTCQNSILGSYFWSWHSDNSGTVSSFVNLKGWTSIEAEFQKAVTVWNTNWVPISKTLVQNNMLVMSDGVSSTILNQAVALPTLTDL